MECSLRHRASSWHQTKPARSWNSPPNSFCLKMEGCMEFEAGRLVSEQGGTRHWVILRGEYKQVVHEICMLAAARRHRPQ